MVEDEASRRRLPSWMAAADVDFEVGCGLKKANDKDESNNDVLEKKTSSSSVNCETKTKSASSNKKLTKIKSKRRKKLDAEDCGEGELTVDDLLTIAKEYAQNATDKAELESLNRDFKSKNQLLTTESMSSSNAPKCIEESPTHPGATSCSFTSEQSGTGDPALDMLDLFLGPLLKKPVEQEEKTEFTTNDEGFRQMSQNDVGEELVLRMKKKGSLKDKVAMLLD